MALGDLSRMGRLMHWGGGILFLFGRFMVADAQKLFRKYTKKEIGRKKPTYPKCNYGKIKEPMGKFEMV